MTHRVVAVDLAKKSFEVAIAERVGERPAHKRFSRRQFERFVAAEPSSVFVVESCGMAHCWARQLKHMGHDVIILPAHYIAAYRRRNKTDRADTLALLEAYRAPDIHPVAEKTSEQQSIQQLHRVREQLTKTRTPGSIWLGRCCVSRALLWPRAPTRSVGVFRRSLKTANGRCLIACARCCSSCSKRFARSTDAWTQLIGSSPPGLAPREHSSGERRRLGGITKQGNVYLRKQLIHGARSALNAMLRRANRGEPFTPLERWAVETQTRVGFNKAVVALANKLARRVFAVCRDQAGYNPHYELPQAA